MADGHPQLPGAASPWPMTSSPRGDHCKVGNKEKRTHSAPGLMGAPERHGNCGVGGGAAVRRRALLQLPLFLPPRAVLAACLSGFPSRPSLPPQRLFSPHSVTAGSFRVDLSAINFRRFWCPSLEAHSHSPHFLRGLSNRVWLLPLLRGGDGRGKRMKAKPRIVYPRSHLPELGR